MKILAMFLPVVILHDLFLLPAIIGARIPMRHYDLGIWSPMMLDVFKYRLFLLTVLLGNGYVFGQRKTLTTT